MFPQNYISLHSKIRLSRKWGTVGTLPTPPQIEMGHPRNTSNAPKHNKYILLTKTKHNYEFGNYFSY